MPGNLSNYAFVYYVVALTVTRMKTVNRLSLAINVTVYHGTFGHFMPTQHKITTNHKINILDPVLVNI